MSVILKMFTKLFLLFFLIKLTIQQNIIQQNTIQQNTIQQNTIQQNTIQQNTISTTNNDKALDEITKYENFVNNLIDRKVDNDLFKKLIDLRTDLINKLLKNANQPFENFIKLNNTLNTFASRKISFEQRQILINQSKSIRNIFLSNLVINDNGDVKIFGINMTEFSKNVNLNIDGTSKNVCFNTGFLGWSIECVTIEQGKITIMEDHMVINNNGKVEIRNSKKKRSIVYNTNGTVIINNKTINDDGIYIDDNENINFNTKTKSVLVHIKINDNTLLFINGVDTLKEVNIKNNYTYYYDIITKIIDIKKYDLKNINGIEFYIYINETMDMYSTFYGTRKTIANVCDNNNKIEDILKIFFTNLEINCKNKYFVLNILDPVKERPKITCIVYRSFFDSLFSNKIGCLKYTKCNYILDGYYYEC